MTTIRVHIESEPHDQDLSGVLLNRPAPNSGSFMIDRRLDRAVWNEMKAKGAGYWSADDLEDMDMFDATPGWRYSLDAIAALLRHGYTLDIRGETIATEEGLRGLFTAEAKAAYKERVTREREEAERARMEAKKRSEEERAARGASYAIWQQTFLAGRVSSSIGPDAGAGRYGAGGPWEPVYTAEKGTPGAWYDTGDRWYQNPQGVLRRDYGNASLWFAPQEVVDSWVLACDDGSVAYARHVLEYYQYGVYGSDIANRLVELKGLDHYLDRARSEEWLIKADRALSRAVDVAAHYGIPMVPIAIRVRGGIQVLDDERALTAALGWAQETPHKRAYSGVGQAADGRWFATTDYYNGGGWRPLTADECTALGLDTAPPATPPTMPEARPLPTAEETAERSRRFSEMFSG